MTDRLCVEIEGISDTAIVEKTAAAVRDSLEEQLLLGSCRVLIRPSCITGRWDITVRGAHRRHALSIASPAKLLPELIQLRLKASLDRLHPSALSNELATVVT